MIMKKYIFSYLLIFLLSSNLLISMVYADDSYDVDYITNYYSFDGSNINMQYPLWGAANTTLKRSVPSAYLDNISILSNSLSSNPRFISNIMCDQPDELKSPDNRSLSDMNWVWGQFITHDIVFTPNISFDTSFGDLERIHVLSPNNDNFYNVNQTMMSIFRSIHDHNSGLTINNPREQLNTISAWLDGSVVYGSSLSRSNSLRTFENGKMNITNHSTGDLLPIAPLDSFEAENTLGQPFFSGDVRTNENLGSVALHVLFLREHNRLADQIYELNPSLNDEEIFQIARKINTAIIQSITYNEFLPSLGIILEDYKGFDSSVNPQISHIFSIVAFRLGHSQIGDSFILMNSTGHETSIPMEKGFKNPKIIQLTGVDSIIRGLVNTNQQSVDVLYDDSIRNFMFGAPQFGGIDLCVLDIVRARDHGIADYNTIRKELGLIPINNWADITSDSQIQQRFKLTYNNVNEIDAIIGVLAEEHLPNSALGETGSYIIKQQFESLRDGDPLFYLNDPDLKHIQDELSNTKLSDIILRNTEINEIHENVFFISSLEFSITKSDSSSILDYIITSFQSWIGFVVIGFTLFCLILFYLVNRVWNKY